VPDPEKLLAYNRYLYAYADPLSYNDPSGHCATSDNGEPDYNDAECWTLVNTILQQWRYDPEYWAAYWSSRYTSPEVFAMVARSAPNDAEFFKREMGLFYQSEEGQRLLSRPSPEPQPPHNWDLGDYTSVNFALLFAEAALTIDDFGNIYVRTGGGFYWPRSLGIALTRGDVYVIEPATASFIDTFTGNAIARDIDNLGLSRFEKRELMQQLMVGQSQAIGAGGMFIVLSASQGQGVGVLDGGIGARTFSGGISASSYTRFLTNPWTWGQ
jgi:hypothetical protein